MARPLLLILCALSLIGCGTQSHQSTGKKTDTGPAIERTPAQQTDIGPEKEVVSPQHCNG